MNQDFRYKTKFHAYQQLDNGDIIQIYFTANSDAVYYKINNNPLSKRCKLYFTTNKKKIYFIAKRKNYYIDDFTFNNIYIPKI